MYLGINQILFNIQGAKSNIVSLSAVLLLGHVSKLIKMRKKHRTLLFISDLVRLSMFLLPKTINSANMDILFYVPTENGITGRNGKDRGKRIVNSKTFFIQN